MIGRVDQGEGDADAMVMGVESFDWGSGQATWPKSMSSEPKPHELLDDDARAAEVASDLAADLVAATAKDTAARQTAASALLAHLRRGGWAARAAAHEGGTLEAAVVILRSALSDGGPGECGGCCLTWKFVCPVLWPQSLTVCC